jgi:hypothetical protein
VVAGARTEEGRRIRRTTLGSFEAWADLVAGAVEWLTGVNPVSLIEERKAEDSGRAAEKRVLAALHELFGEREWAAKEAVGEPGTSPGRRPAWTPTSGPPCSPTRATGRP